MKVLISPSILSADFSAIKQQCQLIVDNGADMIHFDVMDGVFVDNITFGIKFVADLRKHFDIIFDVHLMIVNPQKYISQFAKAGADIITIHYEACSDVQGAITAIKASGAKCGVSIKPNTDIEVLFPYIADIDMILVMSVEPGFGGQAFIPTALDKIAKLRSVSADIDIEVDGGINVDNVQAVIDSGANIIVAGSAIFGAKDIGQAIAQLRGK